jgi:Cornifin (SPRR) family
MWPSAPRRAQAQAAALTESADPARAEVAEPARAEVAEPAQAQVAEPARAEVADPARAEVAEPAQADVAGPARAEIAEPAAGSGARRRIDRSTLLVLGGYLLAALVVTWRLWADPTSRTVAGNPYDADLFAWYMRYAATAIAHGQMPALVTSALNAPAGINVMWNSSSLLPSILFTPITLLFGAQVSLTALTTLGFAGSAAAMFGVLRRWQVSYLAAAIAGALYGFSPALLQSAVGHYDLQLAVLPPLIVDAMVRIAIGPPPGPASAAAPTNRPPLTSRRHQVKTGISLGLLITAQLFISEELALTTVLTGTLLIVILGLGFGRMSIDRLVPTVTGAAVAVGVTLVVAGWALWVQFFGPLTQHGSPFLRDYYMNDLTGFVTPSSYLLFHTAGSAATAAAFRGQAAEYLAYLGWPLIIVLIVAACTFWRKPVIRAFAATVVVLAVLSLGGYPLVSGVSHASVNLPWHWLEELPLGGSVLPDRLSILLDGYAAVLLALALDQARLWVRDLGGNRVRLRTVAVTGVAVLACLPIVPRPLPTASALPLPAGWTAAFAALHLPDNARVLVVPVPNAGLTATMRWQADSGRQYSLIGGYFIGPAWNGQAYIDGSGTPPTAVYLNELWFSGLRPGSPLELSAAADGIAAPSQPPSTTQVHADFTAMQPQAIVAVTRPGSALASYLTGLLGKPTVSTGGVIAWRRG